MDSISAMVSGQPPTFACPGSDGSIGGSGPGLRDCPSPSEGGKIGDGPLDGLCESWENDRAVEAGFRTGSPAVAAAAADLASATDYARASAGLAVTGTRKELPQAARVGDPVVGAGLSASAPLPSMPPAAAATATAAAVTPGDAQTDATFLQVAGEDAITMSAGAGGASVTVPDPVPRPASATPPPVPIKPASVTASFLAKNGGATAEPLALWDGPSDGGTGGAAAGVADTGTGDGDAGVPGTISSQDLLLEWLRREAGKGDEEAQFHLAQLFSPPRFEMKANCRECGETFGVTRYRHHCRHCGGSFCHEHAWHEHPIPKLGLPTPQVRQEWCRPVRSTTFDQLIGRQMKSLVRQIEGRGRRWFSLCFALPSVDGQAALNVLRLPSAPCKIRRVVSGRVAAGRPTRNRASQEYMFFCRKKQLPDAGALACCPRTRTVRFTSLRFGYVHVWFYGYPDPRGCHSRRPRSSHGLFRLRPSYVACFLSGVGPSTPNPCSGVCVCLMTSYAFGTRYLVG